MPSVCTLQESEASIRSAYSYATTRDAEFVVSDNSGDPAKEAFLRKFESSKFIRMYNAPREEFQNWEAAFARAKGMWIGFISDDDLIIPLPGQRQNLEVLPGVVGYKPEIVVAANGFGVTDLLNFQIDADTATGRVQQYLQRNGGKNCALFSFYRRDEFGQITKLLRQYHPTRAGYADWPQVLALVSSGKLLRDRSSLLVYNNRNWVTRDQIQVSNERLFTRLGYEARSSLFIPLFSGLDAFILIARHSSPVERGDRISAAMTALVAMTQSLVHGSNRNQMTSQENRGIDAVGVANNLKSLLEECLRLIDTHNSRLVEPYRCFYRASLGKDWGEI